MSKTIFSTLVFCYAFVIHCISSAVDINSMLIINTEYKNNYTHNVTSLMAQNADCNTVSFKNLDQVEPSTLKNYQIIALAFDPYLFFALAKEHNEKELKDTILLSRLLTIIEQLRLLQNKLIILSLPNLNNTSKVTMDTISTVLQKFGITREVIKQEEEIIKHFLEPDQLKSIHYDTSLLKKRSDQINKPTIIEPKRTDQVITLPISDNGDFFEKTPELTPLYPFALYLKPPNNNNHFALTKNGYLQCADINENIMLLPFDSTLRDAFLVAMQQTYLDLSTLLRGQQAHFTQTFPESLKKEFALQKKQVAQQERAKYTAPHYKWLNEKGIWCAWMSIDPFINQDLSAIDHIVDSGVNALWLQLTPELYLSNNATKKDQLPKYVLTLQTFIQSLKNKARKKGKELPHIFIGLEISGNYANKLPTRAAQDITGQLYSKIPAPLDAKYWAEEVILVVNRFVDIWKTRIAPDVAITGIFFDLEMYHAQDQAGQYTDAMDFSDQAWQVYSSVNTNAPRNLNSTQERVNYLVNNKKLQNYFDILTKKARQIGTLIKEKIYAKLPQAILAVYNINLPHSWFYRGFLAGLSEPKRPIILATFNNNFYTHYAWLKRENIYAYHMPVLLLSKLATIEDFSLIPELFEQHDGVWFNRFSRLAENRNTTAAGNWDWSAEVTPLEPGLFAHKTNEHIQEALEAQKVGE